MPGRSVLRLFNPEPTATAANPEKNTVVLVPTLCVGTDTGDALRPIGHKSKMGNRLAIPSTQSVEKLRSHAERGNERFLDFAVLLR